MTDLTEKELQAIEERARLLAASRDFSRFPWRWEGRNEHDDGFVYHPQGSILNGTLIMLGDTYENDHLDLDYIATMDPNKTLRLIAEIRRLRKKCGEG